ncbi:hypothetical protein [Poseidonibacter lekithochrous]|uniref:hypothetical protein n=1 Tax=Poseidonibacter lekithochrous TaxID=1904463 RepID=UPI0008FC5159|nr:hypothetical protein [Poseidonibacter lekithochrous]QKJ22961.1 hypothetical protein ALEK_1693 [Poseidonibacter lekithochrous]
MKTTHKVILASLVCAIPLGLLAHDKYEDKNQKNENYKESFKSHFFEDDKGDHEDYKYEREFYEKKGVNYIFEGKLEEKPKTGFTGVWKISGNKILVDDTTIIIQEDKALKVGDELYIAAKRQNGQIKAVEIEQD